MPSVFVQVNGPYKGNVEWVRYLGQTWGKVGEDYGAFQQTDTYSGKVEISFDGQKYISDEEMTLDNQPPFYFGRFGACTINIYVNQEGPYYTVELAADAG